MRPKGPNQCVSNTIRARQNLGTLRQHQLEEDADSERVQNHPDDVFRKERRLSHRRAIALVTRMKNLQVFIRYNITFK